MRFKLKLMNGWVSAEVTQDGIELINIFRSISKQHNESNQVVMAIVQSEKHLYFSHQTPDIFKTQYLDQIKACVDVIKVYGGTPGAHSWIMKVVLSEIPGVDLST